MPDQELKITPTNSAADFSGRVFGIDAESFRWIVLTLAAGVGGFIFLTSLQIHAVIAVVLAALPTLVCGGFLIFFHQGKPKGFAGDWLKSKISHGDATPLLAQRLSSAATFDSLKDGISAEGLLVFEDAVAKIFRVDAPERFHASMEERNQMRHTLERVLQLSAENQTLDFQFTVDCDFAEEFRRFQQENQKAGNPNVRALRQRTLDWLWAQMEEQKLKRFQLAIVWQRDFPKNKKVPRRSRQAVKYYRTLFRQLHGEALEFGERLNALLAEIGGSARPMNDLEQQTFIYQRFHPPTAHAAKRNPAELFDPERTLLENCWLDDIRGQGSGGFAMGLNFFKPRPLLRVPSTTYPTQIYNLINQPFGGFSISAKVRRLPVQALIAREQKELDRINQQLASREDGRLFVSKAKREERIRRLSQGDVIPESLRYDVVPHASTPEELSGKDLALHSAANGMGGAQLYGADLPAGARKYFFRSLPGPFGDRLAGVELYGESSFVADLLPFCSSPTAHLKKAEALYLSAGGAPVGFITFTGEGQDAMPMNFVIIGSVGMGKSAFLLNFLLQSQLYYGFTVLIEEGLSHAAYTRSLGLEPICIRLDGNITINFFDTRGAPMTAFQRSSIAAGVARMTGLPADNDKSKQRQSLIAEAVRGLCEKFAQEKLRTMNRAKRERLVRVAALVQELAVELKISSLDAFLEFRRLESISAAKVEARLMKFDEAKLRAFEFRNPAEVQNLVFAFLKPDEQLTLSALQEYFSLNAEGGESESYQWLATLLAPFCRGGAYSNLFDGVSTVDLTGPCVHFELGLIPESAKEIKALIGFLIINDVRQHILSLPRDLRKRVVIEEASRFLDVPNGDKILRELMEQFRKFSCSTLIVVQQYSRLADTPVHAAIVNNTRGFFIFNSGRTDLARLAGAIGLSSVAQSAILRFSRPAQQPDRNFSECFYFEPQENPQVSCAFRFYRLPPDGQGASPTTEPSTESSNEKNIV